MFHFWSSIVNQFDCLFVNFERIIFSMKKLPCYHAFLCECPKIDPDPYYHLSPLFCMFFIFSIYRFCCLHTHTYVLFAIWIVVVVVFFFDDKFRIFSFKYMMMADNASLQVSMIDLSVFMLLCWFASFVHCPLFLHEKQFMLKNRCQIHGCWSIFFIIFLRKLIVVYVVKEKW